MPEARSPPPAIQDLTPEAQRDHHSTSVLRCHTTSSSVEEIMRAAVVNTVAEKAPVISAQALFDNLNDGDASNDPAVLSVRSAEHCALGHIPGAINMPWRSIAKIENLRMLPTDRQIVVYCYTGHTGAVGTAALNLLGYDAVNLKWGMVGWTKDPTVRVASPYSLDSGPDFPAARCRVAGWRECVSLETHP